MPKLTHTYSRTSEVDEHQRALADFESGFHRSRKDNLWREYEGYVVTIFGKDGSYGWCVVGDHNKRFSNTRYENEVDAMGSVFRELSF